MPETRRTRLGGALLVAFATAVARPVGAQPADPPPVVFEGDIPLDGPDHFFLPFHIPPGTEEIEILHDDMSRENVLDFGVNDPNGYRGWGGGTSEPAVIGKLAASRAYVPGPLQEGEWKVVVGKAKVVASPARYRVEVRFHQTPTLAPQTERQPYRPVTLKPERRYYAGDFHVHSRESTDARPDLDEIATVAKARGLDFVEISDHNTVTQCDFFADAQARHPDVLFVPGIEYTTYQGHGNAIGVTGWVDHKIGQPGVTIDGAVDSILAQGGAFSLNHPLLDLEAFCIGCVWKHDLDPRKITAIEIETGGYKQSGIFFTNRVIERWDALVAQGYHIAAIGGSDSHDAGEAEGFASPIGDPVTLVLADELSSAAIVEGIKNGRTVVKLFGPGDPMVELWSEVSPEGDTVRARSTILHAKVTGGKGSILRFVRNHTEDFEFEVTSDAYENVVAARAPRDGEDRWRAEVVMDDGLRHTITSYLFVRHDPSGPELLASSRIPDAPGPVFRDTRASGGCVAAPGGGAFGPWPFAAVGLFGGAILLWRKRSRRRSSR